MQGGSGSTMQLVDMAIGVCTPGTPDMLRSRFDFAVVGLPDGRVVCVVGGESSAEMWGARRRCRGRRMKHGPGGNCPR
jgi:hypothetical protein